METSAAPLLNTTRVGTPLLEGPRTLGSQSSFTDHLCQYLRRFHGLLSGYCSFCCQRRLLSKLTGGAVLFCVLAVVLVQFHVVDQANSEFKNNIMNDTATFVLWAGIGNKKEYHPICDTSHTSSFVFHNRARLEELEKQQDFNFVFVSLASIFKIMVALGTVGLAVVGGPPVLVPSIDTFIENAHYPKDVSMRSCPGLEYVTLGSLIYSAAPEAGSMSSSLIEGGRQKQRFKALNIAEAFPKSARQSASRYNGRVVLQALANAPYRINLGPCGTYNFPWSQETAQYIFFGQLLQFFLSSLRTMWFAAPGYRALFDGHLLEWMSISGRFEVLLPIVLIFVRLCINVDNIKAHFRFTTMKSLVPEGTRARSFMAIAAVGWCLPTLVVFGVPLAGICLSIHVVGRVEQHLQLERRVKKQLSEKDQKTDKEGETDGGGDNAWYDCTHWHIIVGILLATCVYDILVKGIISPDTYLCTNAQYIWMQGQHIDLTAIPLLLELAIMFAFGICFFFAAKVLGKVFPSVRYIMSLIDWVTVEGSYVRWLESPVYNARGFRLSYDRYKRHVDHFMKKPFEYRQDCQWCGNSSATRKDDENNKIKEQLGFINHSELRSAFLSEALRSKDDWVAVWQYIHDPSTTNSLFIDQLRSTEDNMRFGVSLSDLKAVFDVQDLNALGFSDIKEEPKQLFWNTLVNWSNQKPIFNKSLLEGGNRVDRINYHHTLFLPGKDQLLGTPTSLLDQFYSRTGNYAVPGVQRQLNFLLHGPPGTSKTKFVRAVAMYLQRQVVSFSLSQVQREHHWMALLDEKVITNDESVGGDFSFEDLLFVIDEIDTDPRGICVKRQVSEESYEYEEPATPIRRKGKARKDQPPEPFSPPLSLGCILHMLQDDDVAPGRIIVMTSNKVEQLDNALRNPRRIKQVPMVYNIERREFKEMILHFRQLEGGVPGIQFWTVALDNMAMSVVEDFQCLEKARCGPLDARDLGLSSRLLEELCMESQSLEHMFHLLIAEVQKQWESSSMPSTPTSKFMVENFNWRMHELRQTVFYRINDPRMYGDAQRKWPETPLPSSSREHADFSSDEELSDEVQLALSMLRDERQFNRALESHPRDYVHLGIDKFRLKDRIGLSLEHSFHISLGSILALLLGELQRIWSVAWSIGDIDLQVLLNNNPRPPACYGQLLRSESFMAIWKQGDAERETA